MPPQPSAATFLKVFVRSKNFLAKTLDSSYHPQETSLSCSFLICLPFVSFSCIAASSLSGHFLLCDSLRLTLFKRNYGGPHCLVKQCCLRYEVMGKKGKLSLGMGGKQEQEESCSELSGVTTCKMNKPLPRWALCRVPQSCVLSSIKPNKPHGKQGKGYTKAGVWEKIAKHLKTGSLQERSNGREGRACWMKLIVWKRRVRRTLNMGTPASHTDHPCGLGKYHPISKTHLLHKQRKTLGIYNGSEWEINMYGQVFVFTLSLKLKKHRLGRWVQSGKCSLDKREDQGSMPSTYEKI